MPYDALAGNLSENGMKLVVGKREFIRDIGKVESVLIEYERFLRSIPETPDWEEEALELAREHQWRLRRVHASLQTVDLVTAILRQALSRVSMDALRFRLPVLAADPALPAQRRQDSSERMEKLNLLVSGLQGLVQQAPLAMHEKLRILLASISNLFTGLVAGNAAQVDQATNQINLLTSSRESQNLIREIAVIARGIYNAMDAFSAELPLDELSKNAEGISEAVRKLNGVIMRLEQAANQNLDALEAQLRRVDDGRSAMEDLTQALRESQQRLGELKLEHPGVAAILARIQDEQGDGIGSRVMLLQNRAEASRESLISMTANQSFQDLTGQTLKKIIAFIEGLELQIVHMVEKYRPVLGLTQRKSKPAQARAGKADARQSQDQVDAMLADLGF